MAKAEFDFQGDAINGAAAISADDLYTLGLKYSTGEGVEMDYVIAHKWFNLAAMKGNDAAREWRAELSQEMSTADIAKAQKLARAWIASA